MRLALLKVFLGFLGLFASALFALAQNPVVTATSVPNHDISIFEVVTLGKTTLPQFENAIKEQGCHFAKHDATTSVVAPGCFKMPGTPLVIVSTADANPQSNIISNVFLSYKREQNQDLFNLYGNFLQALYGTPYSQEKDSQGAKKVMWQTDSLFIILEEEPNERFGRLHFSTLEDFLAAIREEKQKKLNTI